jgi:hypothetical protein
MISGLRPDDDERRKAVGKRWRGVRKKSTWPFRRRGRERLDLNDARGALGRDEAACDEAQDGRSGMIEFELKAGPGARTWATLRVESEDPPTLHHNLSDLEAKVVEPQTLYPCLNGERLICDSPEVTGSRFLMTFRSKSGGGANFRSVARSRRLTSISPIQGESCG